MTPSIKALAIQAGMYVDVDSKPWPKWMGAEECEKAYAEFAELIVFECIKLAVFKGDAKTGKAIKQHFGVEE
jgi:hypothetical protein